MALKLKHFFAITKPLAIVVSGILVSVMELYAQQVEAERKNFEEARAKAEEGDTESQALVGSLYAAGREVEKDFIEAYGWLNLASRFNEEVAKQRDALEIKMTPQQIADGQMRTKELRAIVERRKELSTSRTNASGFAAETNKQPMQEIANGTIRETYVGGSIFKEEYKRPMRTAIGTRDIFERKEDAGYTELRFQGLTTNGLIILQLTEVETESNVRKRTSQVQIGTTRGVIVRPANDLPPNTTQFTFDPTKERELTIAGYRVRFLEYTQQKLKFSYAK